jgi:hypothetical protein
MSADFVAATLRVITVTGLGYSGFQTKITSRRYTLDVHKVWSFIIE